MNLKTEKQCELQQKKPLRKYHSPSLVKFGDLKELTAGGAGSAVEAGEQIGNPSHWDKDDPRS